MEKNWEALLRDSFKDRWRTRLKKSSEMANEADEGKMEAITMKQQQVGWQSQGGSSMFSSFLRLYSPPWVLFGQKLSRPLCRVIGQITVPDEDDKVRADA